MRALFVLVSTLAIAACGGQPAKVAPAKPAPATVAPATSAPATSPPPTEAEAYAAASPVVQAHCVKCHRYSPGNSVPFMAVDFAANPIEGRAAPVLGFKLREVLGAAGKPARMPKDKPGSLSPSELALMLAWADAWVRAHPDAVPPAASAP